jgi:hypothetical protein
MVAVDLSATSKTSGGLLIVNADDWGCNAETTDKILDCVACGAVSSVSAMVFMEDSERAASIARERGIDAGLHLNFTTPFSAPETARPLKARQEDLGRYLRRHRLAQSVFNPTLMKSFEYVVEAQLVEFRRLYGREPARIDGHHHMHLCANVLGGRLLPAGTFVRRNFSFDADEKSWLNRSYRSFVDGLLARRHVLTDLFFQLEPLEPLSRIKRICGLARHAVVELETHPVKDDEYRFLRNDLFRHVAGVRIAPFSAPVESATLQ